MILFKNDLEHRLLKDMGKVKTFFGYAWEFIRFVLFTPSWGSKRRAEQRAYEERLDEAMRRSQSEQ